MKMTKKKWDALLCLVWAVVTFSCMVAYVVTLRSEYGFASVMSLIWFLNEDREFKQKYPEKKEENNQTK